ncbi:MAG: Jag N-terminal domain-containing protein [Candidatus Omnitrophica bacterium]|nr:Jag N-terminal domain-containing protein [Candidatus Omnitrophota bacterium]
MTQKQEITTIEVDAITVEAAIRKALKMLGAKKKDVEIEILKEEHKGLFGMEGSGLARIKATIKLQNPQQ